MSETTKTAVALKVARIGMAAAAISCVGTIFNTIWTNEPWFLDYLKTEVEEFQVIDPDEIKTLNTNVYVAPDVDFAEHFVMASPTYIENSEPTFSIPESLESVNEEPQQVIAEKKYNIFSPIFIVGGSIIVFLIAAFSEFWFRRKGSKGV